MTFVDAADTPELRKARGAYFTPDPIARFVANWAIREADDLVLEPSAGDAAFLTQAVARLRELGEPGGSPVVHGVEIHAESADIAKQRIRAMGGVPEVETEDFFLVNPRAAYDAVIGNPPFIRYQDFRGESRRRAQAAALAAGVSLTALASSWAAFAVHASLFLREGGRLGLVLPAELLSVNYAGAVRRHLMDRFRSVQLVLFEEQVFPGAEADVLLLLADGYGQGPTTHAAVSQARDAGSLDAMSPPTSWTPPDPAAKWTPVLLGPESEITLAGLSASRVMVPLAGWGDTTLGMVTGNNSYFALSPARVRELRLHRQDVLALSPPGSRHLRGLELSRSALESLGAEGRAIWLFRPAGPPSPEAQAYIDAGHLAGVDQAYKCRVRTPWWRVPLVATPDLFLTCMNADTPRLTTNSAGAHHLNSVHGVYLSDAHTDIGRELLPLAALNSATMVSAEMVGRSYGGGVLKLEPREADAWLVPSPSLVVGCADGLRRIRSAVSQRLSSGDVTGAAALVDEVVLVSSGVMSRTQLDRLQADRAALAERRANRGRSGH